MKCINQNSIIDSILNTYRKELGFSFESYKNHVYRVYNFAFLFLNQEDENEILSVAAAFHDIGIWTNKTFDYIQPSIILANKYAFENNLDSSATNEIVTIINEHHKLSKIKTSNLGEIFRKADLVDLSLGLIKKGLKTTDIQMIRKYFPNKGFHIYLLKLFLLNFLKKPWKPLPMYKF